MLSLHKNISNMFGSKFSISVNCLKCGIYFMRNNMITGGLVFKFVYKRPYLTHDVARA